MKVQLFYILISFFSSFSFTQTIKPRCLEGNCKNKIGTYLYSDSSIYIGSFSDKLRNGQGKITYKSGATYEGEWVNDKRQGQGVFIDSLKNRYEGEWLDDKENGVGKYTDAKGNVYEGTWTNGELKGYITLRYKNKNLYVGEYDKGLKGKGKFTYADGSIYTGNFNKNKRSGYGELVYHFGLTYKGNWISNEIEGQGDFFETKSQKKLATGLWKTEKSDAGHLIYLTDNGYMVCYYKNKDLYYGQVSKGLPNGNGMMVYSNGEVYEGKFAAGQFDGYGRYLYKDKSEYKGEWKNGLREGFGTLVKKDKTEEKGYWLINNYVGHEKPKFSLIQIEDYPVRWERLKNDEFLIYHESNAPEMHEDNFSENSSSDFVEVYRIGLKRINGEIILKPIYKEIIDIENSNLWIVKDTSDGLWIADEKKSLKKLDFYFLTHSFSDGVEDYERPKSFFMYDGLCRVTNKMNLNGFIDEQGKLAVPFIYTETGYFSDGLCSVSKGGKWGFINSKGTLVIPMIYDYAGYFSQGRALVVKNDSYGYIDAKGDVVIPLNFNSSIGCNDLKINDEMMYFEYGRSHYFSKGTAKVFSECNNFRLINLSGEYVSDKYIFPMGMGGYAGPEFHVIQSKQKYNKGKWDWMPGDLYGLISNNGQLIVPAQYAYFEYKNGFIITKIYDDNKWSNYFYGLLDSYGNIILEAKFDLEIVEMEISKRKPKIAIKKTENKRQILIKNNLQIVPVEFNWLVEAYKENENIMFIGELLNGKIYVIVFSEE